MHVSAPHQSVIYVCVCFGDSPEGSVFLIFSLRSFGVKKKKYHVLAPPNGRHVNHRFGRFRLCDGINMKMTPVGPLCVRSVFEYQIIRCSYNENVTDLGRVVFV